jgi:hypothetical protein
MDQFFKELVGRSKYVAQGLDFIVRLGPTTDQAEMIRQELRASGQDPDDDRLNRVQRTRLSRIMDEFQKDVPFQVLTAERPRKLTPKGQELRKVLMDLKGLLRGSASDDGGTLSICGMESLLSAFIEPNCVPFMESVQKEYALLADLCRKKPGTITEEQLENKRHLAGLKIRISESHNDDFSIKSVKNGWADLAAISRVFFKSMGKIDKKDLHHLSLGEEEYWWALPCEQRQVVRFLERTKAGQLPLVKLSGTGPINQKLKRLFPQADWRINASNFEGVRRILQKNQSMGGFLTASAADGLQGFSFIPCKLFESKNGCVLICKQDKYRAFAKVGSFYDFLRNHVSSKK